MSLEHFIITVFCLVDEHLKALLKGKRLRQRGYNPKLTDAEVITMEVVGEFLGLDSNTGIWRYFHEHWLAWFPQLSSRANFAKHTANLWQLVQQIQQKIAQELAAFTDTLHIADGFPIPLCKLKRAGFSRLFRGIANFGYCAAKSETYYGFKGNLVINSRGIITQFTVTTANVDERESLWEIITKFKGLLIADKGLIGEDYQQQIRKHTQVNLQTPARANMKNKINKANDNWLITTRRLVETVIGQLTERFNIQSVKARNLWQLTNRISRKILAHTICAFINKYLGNPPLQFQLLEVN